MVRQGTYHHDRDVFSQSPAQKRKLDNFFRIADFPPKSHLLEVGGGTGKYTIPALQRDYRVTASDISMSALKQLRHDAQELGVDRRLVATVCRPTEQFDWSNNFDGGFCVDVLHHLSSIELGLERIFNALKPGAKFVAYEPNGANPIWRIAGAVWPPFDWKYEKGLVRCTSRNLFNLFTKIGFRDVKITYMSLFPRFLHDRFRFLNSWEDKILGHSFWRKLGGLIIVQGKKPHENTDLKS